MFRAYSVVRKDLHTGGDIIQKDNHRVIRICRAVEKGLGVWKIITRKCGQFKLVPGAVKKKR